MRINQRESQSEEITRSINLFKKGGTSSIIYINGPPGTGKTFTLTTILNKEFPSYIYLNCSQAKVKKNIYNLLIKKITKKKEKGISGLKSILKKENKKLIIVLDEIDLLINKDQSILYNLFDLPYLENVSILMFTIANTMNLTEMVLESKVKSRMGNKKINFGAYTSDELLKISQSGKELELAAKRISALGGDARKMKLIKKEATAKFGKNLSILQVDSVYNEMFKPIYYTFLKNLTDYQKLILISLYRPRKLSMTNLFAEFLSSCKKMEIKGINFFEFRELVRMLIEQNILERNKQVVTLFWNEEEIRRALVGDNVYKKVVGN